MTQRKTQHALTREKPRVRIARLALGAAALLSVLVLPAPSALAVSEWFTADVMETGLDKTGESFIRLSDRADPPAFSKQWFLLPEKVRREMLATGLAAVAADLPVRVRVDLDEAPPQGIKIIYLQSQQE